MILRIISFGKRTCFISIGTFVLLYSFQLNSQTALSLGIQEKSFFSQCPFQGKKDFIRSYEASIKAKVKKWSASQFIEWYSEKKRIQSFETQMVQIFMPKFVPINDLAKKSFESCWVHFYKVYQDHLGKKMTPNQKTDFKTKNGIHKQWSGCLSEIYGGRPSKTVLRMIKCFKPHQKTLKKRKKSKS